MFSRAASVLARDCWAQEGVAALALECTGLSVYSTRRASYLCLMDSNWLSSFELFVQVLA